MNGPAHGWIDGLPVWLVFACEVSYQNLLNLLAATYRRRRCWRMEKMSNQTNKKTKSNSRERERNTLEVKLQNKLKTTRSDYIPSKH